MCQRRDESPFSKLPDECVYYIMNMCRWDWVGDSSDEMRRAQRQARREERQRLEQQADQLLDEGVDGSEAANVDNGVADVRQRLSDDESDSDFMDEESDDSGESDEESDATDEHTWGDHVNHRDAQTFQLPEDSGDSSEDDMDEDELRFQNRFQHRGSLIHRRFFSVRTHLFNALNNGAGRHDTSV